MIDYTITGVRPFTPQFELFTVGVAILVSIVTYFSIQHWRRFKEEKFRPQWIILYACTLQAIWGFSLFFFGITDIAAWAAFRGIPDWFLAMVLIGSSALSYIALIKNKSIGWLLPQQAMMMISAISCVTMVILGHYADGPEYPRIFILRDQLPEILTAIWHTCAIFHRERTRLLSAYETHARCKIS